MDSFGVELPEMVKIAVFRVVISCAQVGRVRIEGGDL